jgi:hypothetical protein
MARQWRASCKARAEKTGIVLPSMPSIDEVQTHLTRAGDRCEYCTVKFGSAKKTKANMDHRVPISRGGGAETSNLALCCHRCNQIKGDCTVEEFLALKALVSTWEDQGKNLFIRLQWGFFGR